MKIGFDMHSLSGISQGTKTYTLQLVNSLLKIDDRNNYFLYYTGEREPIERQFPQQNVSLKKIVPHQRILRIPVSFPIKLVLDGVDLFHCQYMGPVFSPKPYVVSIHDIIHEYMPELYPEKLRFFMSAFYPLSAKRAASVITISENSKRDLMNHYGLSEDKVVVTYIGVSDDFYPVKERERIDNALAKYGIKDNYILYIGRLEPRKNIPVLIRAFHDLKAEKGIKEKLVIGGSKYFKYEEIFNTIKELNISDQVIYTDSIEDSDLPLIYNGASMFVYPSVAEGFGLPPLEAMACGTPVISTNASSIPEVVGDAGILTQPGDTKELAKAIYNVLSNKNLRKRLAQKGPERAKLFTWEKTAKETLEIYNRLNNGKRSRRTGIGGLF